MNEIQDLYGRDILLIFSMAPRIGTSFRNDDRIPEITAISPGSVNYMPRTVPTKLAPLLANMVEDSNRSMK